MIKHFTSLLIVAAMAGTVSAQKIKIQEGNLKDLKGQTQLNVVYDYSNMRVGKFAKEEEYISKKTAEYNAKEPGRGDDWAKKWEGDRKNRFEPSFEELFNKKSSAKIGNFADAKYTVKVHTIFTEPGFNVYVTRKNASINLEITVYETANPDKPICKITGIGFPGRTFGGYDYDTGLRISEAYAKAGKDLSGFFAKNMK
ncbi:MAG: hypothetical protein JSS90_00580 [Bacteroidetes bacterium]|jgi:hypothetical protein|nr:hypothetical protein [Bacteroidota bacterium]